MKTRSAFAKSLREIRKARGLTQESFAEVSSRTYISSLERGIKSPTLEKVEQLASEMKVAPLTLLALTYFKSGNHRSIDDLFKKIRAELVGLDLISR